jgi:hypothetical protein
VSVNLLDGGGVAEGPEDELAALSAGAPQGLMRSLGGLEVGGGSFEVMGPCAFAGATLLTFLHEGWPAGFFAAANSASPTFVPSTAKETCQEASKERNR